MLVATLNTQSMDLAVNNAAKMRIQGTDGFIGINTLAPGFQLEVNGTAAKTGGGVWSTPSDKRLKKDVKPFEDGLKQVLAIEPVFFKYNGEGGLKADGKEYIGVLAQDIQKVAPYTVSNFTHKIIESVLQEGNFVPTETVKGEETFLSYDGTAVTYMLVNAIKEHQKMIEEKDAKITALEERLNRLESIVATLGSATPGQTNLNIQTVDMNGYLMQNQPNPFNQTTTIKYTLPKDTKNAALRVMDSNGRLLKEVKLSTDANGKVVLNAGELSSGTYSYSLVVDGRTLETRQMILTK